MPYQFPSDVKEQLKAQLVTGRYSSEEDVLREALQALKRQNDDLAAIRQAIADMEAGDRGQLFDEFVQDFRKRYKIPQDA